MSGQVMIENLKNQGTTQAGEQRRTLDNQLGGGVEKQTSYYSTNLCLTVCRTSTVRARLSGRPIKMNSCVFSQGNFRQPLRLTKPGRMYQKEDMTISCSNSWNIGREVAKGIDGGI